MCVIMFVLVRVSPCNVCVSPCVCASCGVDVWISLILIFSLQWIERCSMSQQRPGVVRGKGYMLL